MQNIPKETWISPKIEIRDTPEKGKGMFAVQKILAGDELIIWGGEYTDAIGAEKAKVDGKLTMQWDDNLFSVENRGDDIGYFINHSCDSNTWMKDAFTLVAKTDIEIGSEITADYSLWEANENYISKWGCKCGASVCRKRVTGKDWMLPEIQARYKNHFSPLLNKRIEKLQKGFMKRIRAVAIIINDEKILLMHRISHGKEYHVFPGGGVENGETVEQAVLREVQEETSLEVKIEKLLYHHIYDDNTEQFFYLCRYVSGEPKLGDANEARDMKESSANFYDPIWYEIKGLPHLLLYPLEIRDWFIEDTRTNFENVPKEAKIKVSELRQSL